MGIKELFIRYRFAAIGVALLILAAISAMRFISSRMAETTTVEAIGQNNLRFSVYYTDNDLFYENPVPNDLHFIRLFTDFIKIDSSFTASFEKEFDIAYTYTARQRFSIVFTGGTGENSVVYQREEELVRVSGRVTADRLEFGGGEEETPGGIYIIDPDDYLEIFEEFLEYQDRRMEEEGVTATRSFAAELAIEFTYSVLAMPIGIQETTTRGLNIPIMQDVFTLEVFGSPGFTTIAEVTPEFERISPFVVMIWFLVLIGGVLVFTKGIKKAMTLAEPDKQKRLANTILKKYSGEIIISSTPIDMTSLKTMIVMQFDELLKLSINLNKHIVCYRDRRKTEFCTIVDEYAYYFKITYDTSTDSKVKK